MPGMGQRDGSACRQVLAAGLGKSRWRGSLSRVAHPRAAGPSGSSRASSVALNEAQTWIPSASCRQTRASTRSGGCRGTDR
eukprot:scaffold148651_cov31-Tisochrysis_lutea.AAC.5